MQILSLLVLGLVAATPLQKFSTGKQIQCNEGFAPYTYGSKGMFGTTCQEDTGSELPGGAISQCPPGFLLTRTAEEYEIGCKLADNWSEQYSCYTGTSLRVRGSYSNWETTCTTLDGVLVLPKPLNCPPKFWISEGEIDGETVNLCSPRSHRAPSGTSA